jgi:hypothetical protein
VHDGEAAGCVASPAVSLSFPASVPRGIKDLSIGIDFGHRKSSLRPAPGTVLPQLVHGGPARAGGGEELGGPRGLAPYMQRVALEGSRPVIAKILGAKPA